MSNPALGSGVVALLLTVALSGCVATVEPSSGPSPAVEDTTTPSPVPVIPTPSPLRPPVSPPAGAPAPD